MSDTQITGSGAPIGTSGAIPNPVGDSPTPNKELTKEDVSKTVSWENHQRVLDDMHRFKTEAKDLGQKFGDLESQQLRDKEDYKALAEKSGSESKQWQQKYEDLNEHLIKTQKFNAVQKHALQAGLRQEALSDLELLDFKEVGVDVTARGRFIVSGAKEYVDRIKTERPHWFQNAKPPLVNGGGGGAPLLDSKELTAHDVTQAERDYKRGKISRDQYHSVHKEYVKLISSPKPAQP